MITISTRLDLLTVHVGLPFQQQRVVICPVSKHFWLGSKLNQAIKALFWVLIKISRSLLNSENQKIKNAWLQFDLWPVKKIKRSRAVERMIKRSSTLFAEQKPWSWSQIKCFNRWHISDYYLNHQPQQSSTGMCLGFNSQWHASLAFTFLYTS